MAVRYIPQNRREIQLYRRERIIKEKNRDEITRNTLVELRKVNLHHRKVKQDFDELARAFTIYIKKQKHNKVVDVFNYFLSEIE
ncbi:MAG: hypothetical protein GX372_08525 [Ignavibacteria bacterium]|jgi:hypothetical protein|nr:hypothetical protein [Ignavibacteria bacterium]